MESNEGSVICRKGKKVISMDDEEFQDHDHHMLINHRHVINSHVASTSTRVVASTSANRVAIAAPTKQTTATIFKKAKNTSSRGKGHDGDHVEGERVRFVNGECENMNNTSDVLCWKGKKVVSMDDEEPHNDHMVINHQQHANSHMASTSNGIVATTYFKKAKKPREVCGLCKKNFVSVKHLFFHLRDHTYEDWKTFIAPPNTGQNICGHDEKQQLIDLKKSLPTNWSVKQGRRGQTRVPRLMDEGTMASSSTSCRRMREFTVDENIAVEALLLLAQSKMVEF